ncbi:unnamed protein product [Rotaria socialis]|uniref:Uncharacterized protein n=2 Tax=Rotaria socialis TaxID=392032 RepID=A0A818S551_9BILA|nr:unnamed protein product [Rotaria socialis]CAF4234333.1 unnamed protein product [Rotaria socialis]
MSNESHPSPTGSSSSSLFGGGGSNIAGGSGPSPYPSPSKPTWAQILNSNSNPQSNPSTSTTTVTAHNAATTSTSGNNSGGALGNPPSSPSPSSQQSTTLTSVGGTQVSGTSNIISTTTSISSSQVKSSNSGAFNFPGTRSDFKQNFYDQQQQSEMNWPLNFNQTSSWMIDDDTQRHTNLAGSSSKQSVDSNRNTPGGGDGFDRLESSSPTSDWGKPVTNNSAANGWSNFQQQQQTVNNPSRSNAVGNSNTSSNQWPEMNNFYGPNSSNNVPFNLPQNNNDNLNNNSASSTWQDPSLSGNANDTLTMTTGSINSSVINKHKSSSSSSIAASLSGALKSAIALGGANADLLGRDSDSTIVYVPQPKLVEQLGWDEPDIKVNKRPNFDDGTSIWGDPIDLISMQVKKWTNGTKAALTNSTNTISQQPAAIVQKNVPTNMQTSNSTITNSQMVLNDENWPKQQSPILPQQSTSQWNDTSSAVEQPTSSSTAQPTNYRTQQSAPSNWNAQPHQSGHHGSDDWFRDGVVDTSDWGLQGSQNKIPFDPHEGQVDTSSWGIQGGAGGGMGGPLGMPPMNRRFMNDYDPNENTHDPHGMHRMGGYENQSMGDMYRQGPDLKNPIMGLGGLLPSSGNAPPHHMLPPNQLPFAPRPSPLYQPNSIPRPMNPNSIPTQSGAIMGTGSLISPKLSTTSPVPNQAPYVPLAAKQNSMPTPQSQTPTSQQQPQPGAGPVNSGAVHAQIMQQFRLAVQAGLISQDLLNTKLPPYMLQLLQKLFELQQKYQSLSIQLSDFSKHKQRFPITFFQTEYERLSKAITQKKQEMLLVQKQIQDAHAKLAQQQSGAPTPTQMMSNGPGAQNQPPSGVSSTQSQDQLAERMQHSLNVDQSRLHQWTKQQTSTRGAQSSSSMFGPPGLTQKDWQTSGNNSNENWENNQTNDSNNNNNNNNNNNQLGNMDPHSRNNQGSSAFGDALSEFVDDADGPPPFIPGQLWNWKASLPNVEDDPHVTPGSSTMGPKGPSSSMGNLNVGGAESAFSNPQLLHQMHRQQANRSQWQPSLHDQQGFQSSMNDWGKPHQYRGTSKLPASLNHPPPPHASFGGYRPYM